MFSRAGCVRGGSYGIFLKACIFADRRRARSATNPYPLSSAPSPQPSRSYSSVENFCTENALAYTGRTQECISRGLQSSLLSQGVWKSCLWKTAIFYRLYVSPTFFSPHLSPAYRLGKQNIWAESKNYQIDDILLGKSAHLSPSLGCFLHHRSRTQYFHDLRIWSFYISSKRV